MAAAAAVRILHEIQVSAFPSVPSKPPKPLSFLDTMWMHSPHVERLFFYDFPHPTSHFTDHLLPIFTKSLSLTLHHFYPLAGTIRPSPVSDGGFEIACAEGGSVNVTVAEFIGDDFVTVSGHHPRSFESLHLLVPKPAKNSACDRSEPISVQVTLFPNQGLCIGFAISHVACDGSGSMLFVRSWAAACRLADPTPDDISPPFLDAPVVSDTHDIQRKILNGMNQKKEYYSSRKQDNAPVSDLRFVCATFTLSKDHILRLKERVEAKAVEAGKPLFHLSAFVVTCAYVWRCLVKSREHDGDMDQYFVTAVDWRSRMRPQVPSNYLGNCLGVFLTEIKVKELVGKDGAEAAAMEMGKSIDGLRGKDVGEVLGVVIDKYPELARSRLLSVAGSPKLRVYEADFGWGRPVKVDVTSIIETGAMSLAESREEVGGMEIGLVLSEEEMSRFGTNFAADLLNP